MTQSEFQEFLITIGYRYHTKSKSAFNTFDGFHTIIEFAENENKYSFRMSAVPAENTGTDEIVKLIKEFSAEHKTFVTHASYRKKQLKVTVKMTIDSDVDKERLKETAKFFISLCKSGKLVPVCQVCFRKKKTGLYVVGRELMPICDPCVTRKRRIYEKRRDLFEKKHQRMAWGLFGAFFGSSLGACIYMILYQLFPLFGLGSVAIAFLGFCGFVVCGRRATRKSAVICMIISGLVFLAAEYLAMIMAMAIEIEKLSGSIAITEAIRATNMSFSEQSYLYSVLIELGIGLLVMLITGAVYFLKRKYTRPLKISRNIL